MIIMLFAALVANLPNLLIFGHLNIYLSSPKVLVTKLLFTLKTFFNGIGIRFQQIADKTPTSGNFGQSCLN